MGVMFLFFMGFALGVVIGFTIGRDVRSQEMTRREAALAESMDDLERREASLSSAAASRRKRKN